MDIVVCTLVALATGVLSSLVCQPAYGLLVDGLVALFGGVFVCIWLGQLGWLPGVVGTGFGAFFGSLLFFLALRGIHRSMRPQW